MPIYDVSCRKKLLDEHKVTRACAQNTEVNEVREVNDENANKESQASHRHGRKEEEE
jgi:hypothetical protein